MSNRRKVRSQLSTRPYVGHRGHNVVSKTDGNGDSMLVCLTCPRPVKMGVE